MRIGINTFLFDSPFTDKSIKYFELFKEIGFDGVEISLENQGDFDLKKVEKALDKVGIECCSICGAYGAGRDLRGSEKEQETSKVYIKYCIDACHALNCPVFIGPHYSTVGRSNMESEENKRIQWQLVVNNLEELCNYAKKKGVYLAIEPLNRFETDFINLCSDAIRLINDVDSEMLKIHLDTFHMSIEEKSLVNPILQAADLLYHFHASENDRGAPGTGLVDWKNVKDALLRINYDKYVVIETFTPDVKIIAKAASIYRFTEKSNIILAKKGFSYLKALFSE